MFPLLTRFSESEILIELYGQNCKYVCFCLPVHAFTQPLGCGVSEHIPYKSTWLDSDITVLKHLKDKDVGHTLSALLCCSELFGRILNIGINQPHDCWLLSWWHFIWWYAHHKWTADSVMQHGEGYDTVFITVLSQRPMYRWVYLTADGKDTASPFQVVTM